MHCMNLVTGATGLLGSHIVEQLRRRNQPVRALVRRGSDRSWLQSQGVEFAEGDVTDRASLDAACRGCDVVYHSAAKVGDWGPWEDFQRVTIDGTRNTVEAAIAAGVRRFVHVSSISTYGYHTREETIDETYPLGYKVYRWAYYTRSKIIAEEIAWEAHRSGRIELTVIRPAWIYGPRDRATIARLAKMIRAGGAKILGRGDNRLNVVYAGNIAEAAITAAHMREANGEAFNCSNDGEITQQQYFDLLAKALGAAPVQRKVPYRLAYFAGFVLECVGRLLRWQSPPMITRYAVWLMGRRSFFSAEKARRMLNWRATVTYEVGIPQTVQWYLNEVARVTPTPPSTSQAAAAVR
ncbi:MAG: NAD-dependent epimerase/dehydratase family protein [Phycisphaerales bacterium]|nr:NAD-dependent epimerase/dehydratase family protein [Phycisphaerales bacterium]